MSERIQYLHSTIQPDCPDISGLYQQMLAESTLLHPSLIQLEKSYAQGHAVVMQYESETGAFIRFTPLLTAEIKQALRLPQDFPDVWEIGSAIMRSDLRGRGLYSGLRERLLETVQEQVQNQQLLIIGTTKAVQVISVLPKAEKILGKQFTMGVHTDYFIAPLTCVCTPDFGCGYQMSDNYFCPQRVTSEQLDKLDVIAKEQKGKIPCVMYISDQRLAVDMGEILKEIFTRYNPENPQHAFVQRLKEIGYYE